MEKRPLSSAQPTAKAPVMVKRIKVPVKRPVVPGVASAPVAPPAASGVPIAKVPVKRIKVPLKRPVVPGAAPAPVAPPTAVRASVPPPARTTVAVQPPAPPPYVPTDEEEQLLEAIQNQPKPPATARASSPIQREKRVRSSLADEPVNYTLPSNPLNKITAHESVRERFFLFYVYIRLYAEEVLDDEDYLSLPPMAFELPQTVGALKRFKDQLPSEAQDGMMDDISDDLSFLLPLIPEMQRILNRDIPLDDLIAEEIEYMEESGDSSVGEQLVVAYLLVMADMEIMIKKAESRRMRDEREALIEEVQDDENEEAEIQKAFIRALKKENFPIDAEKLIRNYFNFARKEPEKAYRLLTTNPLFYAPVQPEKMPKKFFGLVKAGPKEAAAVNKKLASFLKKLKL